MWLHPASSRLAVSAVKTRRVERQCRELELEFSDTRISFFLLSTQFLECGVGLLLHFGTRLGVLLVGGTDGFLCLCLTVCIRDPPTTEFTGEKDGHADQADTHPPANGAGQESQNG